MYTANGELKNSIVIDGVKYVLSPEVEIDKFKQEHLEREGQLNQEIESLQKQLKQEKDDHESTKLASIYRHYLLDRAVRHEHEGIDIENMEMTMTLDFVSLPFRGDSGYNDKTKYPVKSLEEAFKLIKERMYHEIDRHSTHNYDHCEITIEAKHTEQYKGKNVDFDVPELKAEFTLENGNDLNPEVFFKILREFE